MEFDDVLEAVRQALKPQDLSEVQVAILRGVWDGKSYTQLSNELNYRNIKDTASELFIWLSDKLEIRVTNRKLKDALMLWIRRRVDWKEAPDVSRFCKRQPQLGTLEKWVMQDDCRLVTIVGMGGIGKTVLAAQLTEQLVYNGDFDVVVWRSLRQAPSPVDLVTELILAIAPEQSLANRLDTMICQLLELLHRRRCLLILDNVEAVLSSGELVGTYRPGCEDYRLLFSQFGKGQHRSKVLLTSREIPPEVSTLEGPTADVQRLLRLEGVSEKEGKKILAAKGLMIDTEQPQEVEELIKLYKGNILALEIAAARIKDYYDGNIAAFLAQETLTLLFQGIRDLLTQHFNRLSPLEQEVMYWLAINQEPVTVKQLQADLTPDVSLGELRDVLISLDQRSLIVKIKLTSAIPTALTELGGFRYNQHPVVMEYVIEQLIEQVCQELGQRQINCLLRLALLKAEAKDYVRDACRKLIVQPILARLQVQGGSKNLENLLWQLLRIQQSQAPRQPGYFAGNVFNLLCELGADLSNRDFSNLTIRQADARMVNLQGTNFSHSDLSHSIFTQSFSDVLCVAFSSDAKYFAAGYDSGDVCVWQVEDGQQTATFREIASQIKSLVFSPDGETLIISNADQIVKLLHIPSRSVRELPGHTGAVWAVAISVDGRLLASGGEDLTIRIWDMQTKECVKTLTGHQGWVSSLAFVPSQTLIEGYFLVSGGGDGLRLWHVESEQTVHIFNTHTQGVLAVACSPDGQTIASSSVDHRICLWALRTREEIAAWQGHDAAAWTLAFSPDSQTLVSGSEDQTIKQWNVKTRQLRRTLHGHKAVVQSIAFTPDGLVIVSAAFDQSIRRWDAKTGQCLKTWRGYSQAVYGIAFHPDGQMLASCYGDKTVRLWNVQAGNNLRCFPAHKDRISSVVFSPDGRKLASGSFDQTVCLWDVESWRLIDTFQTDGWVNSVTFSSDGLQLASSGIGRAVHVWNIRTRQRTAIETEANWIPAVAFSPTTQYPKQYLASSHDDGTVNIWDPDTSECLLKLKEHMRQVKAIAFDPVKPRLASGSDDGTVKLWDLQTRKCLQTLQGHTRPVVSIGFHPQGNLIVSGSSDRTLKLWNLEQEEIQSTDLQGHTSPILSIAFNPKGTLLAGGSKDGTIYLWDSCTGECLQALTAKLPYEGMNISGVMGLTDAQIKTLLILGAIECY